MKSQRLTGASVGTLLKYYNLARCIGFTPHPGFTNEGLGWDSRSPKNGMECQPENAGWGIDPNHIEIEVLCLQKLMAGT